MYTTRFPHEAKVMQLKRQVVFESVNGGRIHEQVLDLRFVVFSDRRREKPTDGSSMSEGADSHD
jgi:hypothetical protein